MSFGTFTRALRVVGFIGIRWVHTRMPGGSSGSFMLVEFIRVGHVVAGLIQACRVHLGAS